MNRPLRRVAVACMVLFGLLMLNANWVQVVKADAYGHGLVDSARAALAGGASWLGVAQLGEALRLREAGVSAPLLTWLFPPGADIGGAIDADIDAGRGGDYAQWRERVAGWKASFPVGYTVPEGGTLAPQYVMERLSAIAGPEAIYVAGVGQHQMWAAQFVQYERPNAWLNSGGLGTMGYAVPAAMGAKVGRPEATVWAIDGDGCFQMTNQELVTCAIEGIPIKVAIINNGNLGMVRQWQTLFYGGRYSNTNLQSKRIPDFVKLADAMGCVGLRCDNAADVDATIEKAMAVDDMPVVVDFLVGTDAMVWPMVPAGTSNDEILAARDTRPVWDANDV